MAILVTGATGIVGCELVSALLAEPGNQRVYTVVRGDAAALAQKERWLREWVGNPGEERLVVEAGDCEVEGFGLSSDARARIERDVTGVVHSAASTAFDMSADEAFIANVLSTRHALGVAKGLRNLERFGFVSSAYIAGARSGRILEDGAQLDGKFDNEYTRSKAFAETEVLASGLPAVAYRLGIVLGRESDGVASRTTGGPYLLMRLVHEGLIALYPAGEGQTVDLLPVDFAARAIAHLFCSPQTRPIFHVCAGDAAIATGDFFVAIVEALRELDPQWRAQGLPMPIGAPVEALREFRKAIDLVANPRLQKMVRRMDQCVKPVELAKRFDTTAFEAAMEGSGLCLPAFNAYFPRVVAHAARNGFRPTRRPWDPA